MKKLFFASIVLLLSLQACYDDYKTDYAYSTAYFAYQYPVRTLEYTEDEDLVLEIGVSIGGKYTNEKNETIEYAVAPRLIDSVAVVDSTMSYALLPEDYYTVSDDSRIVVSSGKFIGSVDFILNKEKFLADTLAHTDHYLLPLEITASSTDSVLAHKDFVMAVVKYINPYHGNYWLKGADQKLDLYGNPVDTVVYSENDLVLNQAVAVSTEGKNTLKVSNAGRFVSSSDADYSTHITIREDGQVTLSAQEGSIITSAVGGGLYSAANRELALEYRYVDEFGSTHQVNDTLIYRDTRLTLELWANNPEAIEE